MIKDWQDTLRDILSKEISSLTERDKSFIRARRSYLTPEQAVYYDAIIMNIPTTKTDNSMKPTNQVSYKALIAKAKELGFKARAGMKRQEIQQMIDSINQ